MYYKIMNKKVTFKYMPYLNFNQTNDDPIQDLKVIRLNVICEYVTATYMEVTNKNIII